jgi:hypothetical protein
MIWHTLELGYGLVEIQLQATQILPIIMQALLVTAWKSRPMVDGFAPIVMAKMGHTLSLARKVKHDCIIVSMFILFKLMVPFTDPLTSPTTSTTTTTTTVKPPFSTRSTWRPTFFPTTAGGGDRPTPVK